MKDRNIQRKGSLQALIYAAILLGLIAVSLFGTEPGSPKDQPITNKSLTTSLGSQDDAVLEWNQHAIARVLASGLPAPRQMRAMSIVQVSVHDAVNGLSGEYRTYLSPETAPENASVEGAAIAAAYGALRSLFGQSTQPDDLYTSSLAQRGISEDDPGVAYGLQAAANIFALRSADGNAQAACAYIDIADPQPGEWVRIINPATGTFPPAALPCFGNVTPWVLKSGSQFRPEAPPDLLSERYTQDYNEILALGELNSTTRTFEQTQIARFFDGSPTNIWNQVLRQVAASREMDLSERARAFALVYMTSTDASIACWEAKYHYLWWRPTTAIARSLDDGNPLTNPQPGWQSFLPQWMHQHPEYPSGQSTNSAAMASVMALIFGESPGITMTPTIGAITREWETFDEGIDEVISARVYSGIHFRSTDEASARMAKQVARFVFTHALSRCNGKGNKCP